MAKEQTWKVVIACHLFSMHPTVSHKGSLTSHHKPNLSLTPSHIMHSLTPSVSLIPFPFKKRFLPKPQNSIAVELEINQKKMRRLTKKAVTEGHSKELDPSDRISRLPDGVLIFILSMLPIDEAVRSSVLSKRWKTLWRHTSHLDFDVKHMIYPLTRLSTSPEAHSEFILSLSKQKGIYRFGILVFLILSHHVGDLTTCRFLHFPQMEVETWIHFLVAKKKGLRRLTLECEPFDSEAKLRFPRTVENTRLHLPCRIFSSLCSLELINYVLDNISPFQACENLRTLKMKKIQLSDETLDGILRNCRFLKSFKLLESTGLTKIKIRNPNLEFLELGFLCVDEIEVLAESLEVLAFASLICPVKSLVIGVPRLRVFHSYGNPQTRLTHPSIEGIPFLKTQEILEYCSGLLDSKRSNIFRNLSSVIIDLDLNVVREALALSFILRSCVDLQTLKIIIPVNKRSTANTRSTGAGASSPYPSSNFWEGREICNCIRHKLKFVYIVGFTGKALEADFIKYLIMRATKMVMITIVCNSSIEVAAGFLSLEKASANLSIKLRFAQRRTQTELAEL